MRSKLPIIIILALVVMSQSKWVIQSKYFCNIIISDGCLNDDNEKECYESEACHGSHSYQCDHLRCAVNKTECNEFLKMNKLINSKTYKINDFSRHNYKRFLDSFGNCEPKPHIWKGSDVCLKKKKFCFTQTKSNSIVFKLGFNKKPTLIRKRCSCDESSHPYECNKNYCALDNRSCKEFNGIESMQSKKDMKIKHCEYH